MAGTRGRLHPPLQRRGRRSYANGLWSAEGRHDGTTRATPLSQRDRRPERAPDGRRDILVCRRDGPARARRVALTDRLYAGTPRRAAAATSCAIHPRWRRTSGRRDRAAARRAGRRRRPHDCAHEHEVRREARRRQQLFGLTEFVDDESRRAPLPSRGARPRAEPLFGPVRLLPNQSGGVITSGFEERGFIDSP